MTFLVPIECVVWVLLLGLSAFFLSAETGALSLNRRRLRHRAAQGAPPARILEQFLDPPDRLVILAQSRFAGLSTSQDVLEEIVGKL